MSSYDVKEVLQTAVAFHENGDLENAISNYMRVLSIDSGNEIAGNNLGIIYVIKENYEKAIEFFSNVIRNHPRSIDAYFNLGKAFMLKEDYLGAIRVYEQANKLSPKDSSILKSLAYSYKLTGDFENSLVNYRQVLNFIGDDTEVLYQIAEIYYLMSKYERAVEYSLKILNREPDNWKAKGLLAECYFYLKNYKECLNISKQLVEENPDRLELREKLAEYYLGMGEFEKALLQFESILTVEPTNVYYLNRFREIKKTIYNTNDKNYFQEVESTTEERFRLKAKKFFDKKDYAGLIREFSRELIDHPENLFLLKNIGRAYELRGELEEAIKYYSRYLDKREDQDILWKTAKVYNELGRFIDSRKKLERLIKLEVINDDIILLQADNLKNMGIIEEAISLLEKRTTISCGVDIYRRLGEYLMENSNLSAAYTIFSRVVKKFSGQEDIYLDMAKINLEDKNLKRAFKNTRKFVEDRPDDFEGLEFLSRLYIRMRKPKDAYNIWKEIINKRPKNTGDILIKAEVLLFSERLEEALSQLKLIKEEEKDWKYYFLKGLYELMREEYDRSSEFFETSIEKDRELFENDFFFVVKYFDKEKLNKLVKRWEKYENEIISA